MTSTLRTRLAGAAAFALCLALAAPAQAAGSNMPWEQPLQQVLDPSRGRSPRSSR
jgi:type IV secretion system protein VirB2